MISRLLSVALFVWTTNVACATTHLDIPRSRAVFINGSLTEHDVTDALAQLDKLAEPPKPRYLVINSPGGVVTPVSLQALHSIATAPDLVCVVTGLAVSLAMAIFSHCPTRVVTKDAQLLWHGIRFVLPQSQEVTATVAKTLFDHLQRHDDILWAALRTHMSPDFFTYHLVQETLFTPEALKPHAPLLFDILDVTIEPPLDNAKGAK